MLIQTLAVSFSTTFNKNKKIFRRNYSMVLKDNIPSNPFVMRVELREYEMQTAAVKRLIRVHCSAQSLLEKKANPLCSNMIKQNYLSL